MSRTAPAWLREAFRRRALDWYLHGEDAPDHVLRLFDGGPACWLAQFDPLERPCSGRIEAVHLISQQRIEKALGHQLTTDLWAERAIDPIDVPDLVELAAKVATARARLPRRAA